MTYPQKELQIMDLRHSYDRRTRTQSQYSQQSPQRTRAQGPYTQQNPQRTRVQGSYTQQSAQRTRPQGPYTQQNPQRTRARSQKYRVRQERRRRTLKKLLALCFLMVMALCIFEVRAKIPSLPGRADTGTTESLSSWLSSEQGTVGHPKPAEGLTEKLSELLEKNEETKTFVENYVNRSQYIGQPIDLTADFNPGEVPLLMQWDLRWGYESLGESIIGLSGCGPTCLSMAYLYFTQDITGDPRTMAQFCEKNGYYTSAGTSWSLWTSGLEQLGLSGRELSLSESTMKSALDNGSLIVCSMRPGDFTTTGHYILICGYDENGFYVNDPNRRSTSGRQWDYDTLSSQIKNLWEISDR